MDSEKYAKYGTEDFVLDKDFSDWVMHPHRGGDEFWAAFLRDHPDFREPVREAAFIVRSLQPVEEDIPDEALGNLYNRILQPQAAGRKIILRRILRAAAVLIPAAGLGGWLLIRTLQSSTPFLPMDKSGYTANQGRVILADGSSVSFDTKQTVIRQAGRDSVVINRDTVAATGKTAGGAAGSLNRVIIPYGKRSEISLSDGTRVWLNSGSSLAYPPEFTGDTRDVYLTGEAYFDVKHDESKPFHVITRDIRIAVLGTRFNVTAFDEDSTVQTVLLSGKVSVRKNAMLSKAQEISPGERILFNRDRDAFNRDRVDVQYVTSWVNGYLIFQNEPTPSVFRKLERYYNRPIDAGSGLGTITFSGKLDLKENLPEVLEAIAFASSLKVMEEGGRFKVNR